MVDEARPWAEAFLQVRSLFVNTDCGGTGWYCRMGAGIMRMGLSALLLPRTSLGVQ